ncbi:hypothetical protein POVWA1_030110 [Plasmodium ovale wallikeri]|uniref:Uncharacterized protein n=1 Tax=Plasmodium ovale wallikeri TaxID=864142 RepID=A0A1A8YWH2_PLAOA|nr:hypothetical protein POVWA1_030110 [Plasmodium ovale wallikeri]
MEGRASRKSTSHSTRERGKTGRGKLKHFASTDNPSSLFHKMRDIKCEKRKTAPACKNKQGIFVAEMLKSYGKNTASLFSFHSTVNISWVNKYNSARSSKDSKFYRTFHKKKKKKKKREKNRRHMYRKKRGRFRNDHYMSLIFATCSVSFMATSTP